MKTTLLLLAMLGTAGLAACERNAPVVVPVAVPGPTGATGATGSTGQPGEGTTVIVVPPAASAASN